MALALCCFWPDTPKKKPAYLAAAGLIQFVELEETVHCTPRSFYRARSYKLLQHRIRLCWRTDNGKQCMKVSP